MLAAGYRRVLHRFSGKAHGQYIVSRGEQIRPAMLTDKRQISGVHVGIADQRSECPKQRRAVDGIDFYMALAGQATDQ